ncbi:MULTISPECIES: M81 family metallopeptidase [unclassified Salipiger]|uniref:M81 family metallopeptidase n=1 Tax=unclassified Salipiger TaxID=2640570 RepID=UPI0013BCA1D9|nr:MULTISPECIES: M81 family metallopeptidase [unclassified Salipiger]NDV53771.1 M81 family metallopeptidase [Salipiger sp. PrR003]NDW35708.1 M81 family metallopeptidase [Salipiger sp. PrR007]
MTPKKRIAVGGIHTECSTYNPVLIRAEDFTVMRGAELTASAYFAFLPQDDVEILPLLHARAVPGGPVDRPAYEGFKSDLLSRLEAALPLDGVYLAMHGAMHVDGMWDAEGDWIKAVRDLVGPEVPISVSYDLHGNVSQRIIDQIDMFAAYRTAPHIDVTETMQRAWEMLLRCLRSGERPFVTWAKIPVLMPGERSSTEDEPAKSLYAALPAHDRRPGIWSADQMVGYVWADEPRGTAAAIVTATDAAEAEAVASELARAYWDARGAFAFGPITGPLGEMLDIAAKASTSPVILAESGDNPTGGGVGDNGLVLKALIERDWQDALIAGITDPEAVAACFAAGVGAELELTVGAKLDPAGTSATARFTVMTLVEGAGGAFAQAVVRTGGITLVLAARRRPYHNFEDFELLGLDPRKVGLLVVKSGYLSPDLAPIANPNLMALTDGVVNQDIPRLESHHRAPGLYPWDTKATFTPAPTRSARA